jgi:hypothetical protein
MKMERIKDKIVEPKDLGIYRGDIAVHIPEMKRKPNLHFTGTPMPVSLWRQCLGFLKWSYDEHKCESQLRLFYNVETGEWKAEVMPQKISFGMTTQEIEGHKDRDAILEGLGADFHSIGSIHHHCNAGAFQSGTDYADEIKQNGLHVTVGCFNQPFADFHARISFRRVMYERVRLSQWFEEVSIEHMSLENLPEFPEVWKTRMIQVAHPNQAMAPQGRSWLPSDTKPWPWPWQRRPWQEADWQEEEQNRDWDVEDYWTSQEQDLENVPPKLRDLAEMLDGGENLAEERVKILFEIASMVNSMKLFSDEDEFLIMFTEFYSKLDEIALELSKNNCRYQYWNVQELLMGQLGVDDPL